MAQTNPIGARCLNSASRAARSSRLRGRSGSSRRACNYPVHSFSSRSRRLNENLQYQRTQVEIMIGSN
jgi:hypothetical protein